MEDKQKICEALLVALQFTYSYADVEDIVFEKDMNGDDDMVTVSFRNGTEKRIYVGMDNGFAMCKDILNNI